METDPDGQLVRGHTYSGIFTQDNARVHLGDVYSYGNDSTHSHNYYFCSSSSQHSSGSLTFGGHAITGEASERLSLKRRRLPDRNEYKHKLNKEESLEHVLSKLGKFSKSIQDQRIGKDAKKIIRRVALALNAIKQQARRPVQSSAGLFMHTTHDKNDFKNIRKSLEITGRVDVNTHSRRTRHTKLARVICKYDRIAFEQWEITLKTTTFESRDSDGTEVIESRISLCLEPRLAGSRLPVTVHLGETRTHTGITFINPIILAYRTVPTDSEVFAVVEKNDLAGLITLLADGKATLRDCNEEGSTLLHHACKTRSPRCCQYLVDKGADIEGIATFSYGSDSPPHQKTPLYLCTEVHFSGAERGPVECGRILLKAGADPTFTSSWYSPPIMLARSQGPDLFDIMCVEGISFIDVKNFRYFGKSLWLSVCHFNAQFSRSNLQRLISIGCDIAEKDENDWNCLFYSVNTCFYPDNSRDLEKLQYLLGVFDDIHARDAMGRTIFDYLDVIQDTRYGSYRRDLWYCALERAGFDVDSHLIQHPRVPKYKIGKYDAYTPEHYHALKHLHSWDRSNFRLQMDRLLREIPLDEDEAMEMESLQRKKLEKDFDSY